MSVLSIKIKKLLREGATYSQIIADTGVCKATISYHKRRLELESQPDPRIAICIRLIQERKNNREIRAETSLSHAAITKYRRQLGIASPNDPLSNLGKAGDYDWSEIQRYHDQGHHLTACQAKFGFAKASWSKAVKRGDLVARPKAAPLVSLLVERSTTSRVHLKARLIDESILPNQCAICHRLPEWEGQPLVLILDHINGVNDDNRLENLRLLCPNCNSQTDTFAGRNTKKVKAKRAEIDPPPHAPDARP